MTADALDPHRDRMIAALYGELSAEEERALHEALAMDAGLRAEWEELTAARGFLQESRVEEKAPAFSFLLPVDSSIDRASRSPRETAREEERRFETRRAGSWAALRLPIASFALGAAALLVLMLAGLRVDRENGALVVRFGETRMESNDSIASSTGPSNETVARGDEPAAGSRGPLADIPLEEASGAKQASSGIPLEPASRNLADARGEPAGGALRAGDGVSAGEPGGPRAGQDVAQAYLTRAEFAEYSNQFVQLIAQGLTDYDRRREAELVYVLNGIYNDLDSRQKRHQDEMNAQFADALLKLAAYQATGSGGMERPLARPSIQQENTLGPSSRESDGTTK